MWRHGSSQWRVVAAPGAGGEAEAAKGQGMSAEAPVASRRGIVISNVMPHVAAHRRPMAGAAHNGKARLQLHRSSDMKRLRRLITTGEGGGSIGSKVRLRWQATADPTVSSAAVFNPSIGCSSIEASM